MEKMMIAREEDNDVKSKDGFGLQLVIKQMRMLYRDFQKSVLFQYTQSFPSISSFKCTS